MDFVNIFGYTATGLSVCFYCSLVVPFFNVLRCKLNYEYTPIALINTIYVDSIAWYIYADKIVCDQLRLCNSIGTCCSLILITIYLAFELKKYLVDSILNCLILILGTLVLHKGLSIVIEDAQIVGKICIGTKLISFFTPLVLTWRVIKEKNYRLISVNTTLTYMASCIGWVLFGKSANDLNIMCANTIGVILCLIQFIVYLNFKKKYKRYSTPTSTIGIENTSGEESKKEESSTMNIDEESQDKAKEKPVKIITRIDN
jgi:uncharacterized protein with PQ loop repeat